MTSSDNPPLTRGLLMEIQAEELYWLSTLSKPWQFVHVALKYVCFSIPDICVSKESWKCRVEFLSSPAGPSSRPVMIFPV